MNAYIKAGVTALSAVTALALVYRRGKRAGIEQANKEHNLKREHNLKQETDND